MLCRMFVGRWLCDGINAVLCGFLCTQWKHVWLAYENANSNWAMLKEISTCGKVDFKIAEDKLRKQLSFHSF